MSLGPSQNYLIRYNSYQLPGYAQSEIFDSEMEISRYAAPFADGSLSEYTGLNNKSITLTLKLWEADYQTCKDEMQKAATIVRSKRNGFAPLYIQYTDRYYEAMNTAIKHDKSVPSSTRILDYQLDFECKPWLTSVATYTVSGVGVMQSDGKPHMTINVSRDLQDGGWTPTTITMTGEDITISGYTVAGEQAGFMSVDGAVTNLIVDSYQVTSTISGNNVNDQMLWADYRIYIGPGDTSFDIIGANTCSIEYHNRWYI